MKKTVMTNEELIKYLTVKAVSEYAAAKIDGETYLQYRKIVAKLKSNELV